MLHHKEINWTDFSKRCSLIWFISELFVAAVCTLSMKCPRSRSKLVLSKAFHPPPIGPPPPQQVAATLGVPRAKRTPEDLQILLRFFVAIQTFLGMLENSDRVRQAAKTATVVTIHKDDILFFEGDDPDGWFMVLTGTIDVIIRLFLVAEDCLISDQEYETTEFAQLSERMELDPSIDKLKRVKRLKPGEIFGQHAYLLDRPRSATLVASSDVVDLVRFEPEIFQQTSSLITAKTLFAEHSALVEKVFPRLREDQVTLIAALAEVIELKAGRTITAETSLGRWLYIIKTGTIARSRVVDFTALSFRKCEAPFEPLELHFPNGMHPVHTDNLEVGALFADPVIEDLTDSMFIVKTATPVKLLALDADYFRIVAGRHEIERVREDLKSDLTDELVIKIWVNTEKARLWEKFKQRVTKAAHREIKTELQFKNSTLAIRIPKVPTALKDYRPKKVEPYASKSLRGPTKPTT
jgi:CRP-like cAMP-binding protein